MATAGALVTAAAFVRLTHVGGVLAVQDRRA
jgi:hypothetical protein